MEKDRIKRVTKKYNTEKSNFGFPTVSASYDQIKSIMEIHPSWEELNDDMLIYRIATYLNYSAFSWS